MARKDHIIGSGNVFEDLGRPRPAEALAKAELARKFAESIAERRLTQAAAAALLERVQHEHAVGKSHGVHSESIPATFGDDLQHA